MVCLREEVNGSCAVSGASRAHDLTCQLSRGIGIDPVADSGCCSRWAGRQVAKQRQTTAILDATVFSASVAPRYVCGRQIASRLQVKCQLRCCAGGIDVGERGAPRPRSPSGVLPRLAERRCGRHVWHRCLAGTAHSTAGDHTRAKRKEREWCAPGRGSAGMCWRGVVITICVAFTRPALRPETSSRRSRRAAKTWRCLRDRRGASPE
jgi:hypothetical protein